MSCSMMKTLLALPPSSHTHTQSRFQFQTSLLTSSAPSSPANSAAFRASVELGIAPFALALALFSASSPSSAIASETPYSQSKTQTMEMGLLDGKIRSCPSNINPNCISTSSMNASFALPWVIPEDSAGTATRKLLNAIQSTQRNPKVIKIEDTPNGQFLQVEVDGLFGRDAMEFLVKSDVVTYRSLAEKVIYVYPFTTPLSDFGAQGKRIKALEDELGWSIPRWDSGAFQESDEDTSALDY